MCCNDFSFSAKKGRWKELLPQPKGDEKNHRRNEKETRGITATTERRREEPQPQPKRRRKEPQPQPKGDEKNHSHNPRQAHSNSIEYPMWLREGYGNWRLFVFLPNSQNSHIFTGIVRQGVRLSLRKGFFSIHSGWSSKMQHKMFDLLDVCSNNRVIFLGRQQSHELSLYLEKQNKK